MKLAVTGAAGVLGREVVREASRRGIDVLPLTRHGCDVADAVQVWAMLRSSHPDVVVNCAGRLPGEPLADLLRANTLGPHVLAGACMNRGARLVHVSTDCVFGGRRGQVQWRPSDPPCPTDAYGYSKMGGEGPWTVIVRTSFVSRDAGLVGWLAEQARAGPASIPGWTRARWSGSTVYEVARRLVDLAEEPPRDGIYHLATAEPITKYDLLRRAAEVLDLEVRVDPVPDPVVERGLEPTLPPLPPFAAARWE